MACSRALLAAVTVSIGVFLLPGCGDESAYCERARHAFDEIGRAGTEPSSPGGTDARLDRLRAAFAGLEDGVPEEVRDDVGTMTRWLASLRSGDELVASEPPEVRAASERFTGWLGRTCEASELRR